MTKCQTYSLEKKNFIYLPKELTDKLKLIAERRKEIISFRSQNQFTNLKSIKKNIYLEQMEIDRLKPVDPFEIKKGPKSLEHFK